MKSKSLYTTPTTKVISMATEGHVAGFIITSKSVGEDAGDAKGGFFDEEDETYE